MNAVLRERFRDHVTGLETRLEAERDRRVRAEDALQSIFTAPDLDAIFAEIERAEDDFAAVLRRSA